MKLAVFADIHLDPERKRPECLGHLGDVLLTRAVFYINRFIRPDAVAFLGDLVEDAESDNCIARFQQLREAIDKVNAPLVTLPGNHDGPSEEFFEVFGAPPEYLDVAGARLVPMADLQTEGFNAYRTPENLQRMQRAAIDAPGPLISLQHVPLFPPGKGESIYNYTNAEEVLEVMEQNNYSLSISGHYHPGMEAVSSGSVTCTAVPALCEPPFTILEIEIESDGIKNLQAHELQLPEGLNLTDWHVHTEFAYCSQNMEIGRALQMGKALGLETVNFVEHSGQLYFPPDTFWTGAFMEDGIEAARTEDCRMDEFFRAIAESGVPLGTWGFEVDCDFQGRPVLLPEHEARGSFTIGATHWLPSTRGQESFDKDRAGRELMEILPKFLNPRLTALAHPFRVFARADITPPAWIFPEVVKLLKEHDVAAEINFHNQTPPAEFIEMCLNEGVKLCLGSDSHNLAEIGFFHPHLQLLSQLGVGRSE
ncbi:MAG: metallophosphoesterase, partial [Verrucomicrobiota bacterium]